MQPEPLGGLLVAALEAKGAPARAAQELRRQRWSGTEDEWFELHREDLALNAAGLGAWIERGKPQG